MQDGAGTATGPLQVVKNTNSKSHVWRYFTFETNDQGQVMDNQKLACKQSFAVKREC